MGASLQSLRHVFSAGALAAGIFSFGGLWHVFHVDRNEVEVEESSWKMMADWLVDFPVVLETLPVHLEMTVLVLGFLERGAFVTRHNHLGAGHILTTVAHNVDILGLRLW